MSSVKLDRPEISLPRCPLPSLKLCSKMLFHCPFFRESLRLSLSSPIIMESQASQQDPIDCWYENWCFTSHLHKGSHSLMNESAWLFVKMLKQISKGWRIDSQQSSVEDLMNKLFLLCSKGSPNSALWERKGDQTDIRLKLISKAILRVYGCELAQKTPGNICTPWVPLGKIPKALEIARKSNQRCCEWCQPRFP